MSTRHPKVKTPNYITHLSKCEIFVFGSNLAGHHHGGAARMAHELFGAEWGVGSGRTGQCYAIPTMQGGTDTIRPYVDEFIEYAKAHPMNRFLVTRVGCGIAGFTDKQMAALFVKAMFVPNITLPSEWKLEISELWQKHYGKNIYNDIANGYILDLPKVITIEILQDLCNKFRYQIGASIHNYLPSIHIRYVLDTGKFGYTYFGNFFFYNNELYVFDDDDEFQELHDAEAVLGTFEDECEGHGYAHKVIFAGVETPYKDVNGDYIYTGDAVITDRLGLNKENIFGVRPLENFGDYAIMLDNHCLPLNECHKIVRVGTVFFNLPKKEDKKSRGKRFFEQATDMGLPREGEDMLQLLEVRCRSMHSWYGGGPSGEENLRHVRFTPNFFTSELEYMWMERLRDEDFDWRK